MLSLATDDELHPDLLSTQETLNFWKQLTHVLKYFRAEEDPKSALPKNFIQGFLEVRNALLSNYMQASCIDAAISRDATREQNNHDAPFDFPQPFRNDTILNRNPIVSICTRTPVTCMLPSISSCLGGIELVP